MVLVIPVQPLVFVLNILCSLLPCRNPYQLPEIVYDHSNDLISAKYLNNSGSDYFDVSAALEKNVVQTNLGVIEGYYQTTTGGRKIGAFEGIRYAKAERWEKSVPTHGWSGVLHAKAPGPDCLQINARKVMKLYGEEDCLYLNVYTPVISGNKTNAALPVVVYIHGGSFLFGTGREYGAAYLLNEDIVLVTLNYRVGVLGFMSTGDSVLPGNLGLKDQVLAIKWVKEHITEFGGNPESITLWGFSAGGVAVHLHMMSPQTKDLFSRAISQSATAFCHWGLQPPSRLRGYTEELANYFHCPVNDATKMVNCLKDIDPVSVVAAQTQIFRFFPFPVIIFTPTVELENYDESAFLTEWPDELYKKGEVSNKPWIVSTSKHEGLTAIMALELSWRWSAVKLYWNRVAKHVLDLDYLGLPNLNKIIREITRFYFGNRQTTAVTWFDYSNMITDRYFRVPVIKGIQAHSEIGPVYPYYFPFNSGNYSMGDWNLHRPKEWGLSI
ncbi:Esterase FE4 [Folsomia candida]|uniref:Carboxylic ester hydrolase n=1 Tax=Folsomia candida TaxID=158441 RepID=A0A226DHR9_FOLCA|nr:Esterase FE4 [Folsomia candida]